MTSGESGVTSDLNRSITRNFVKFIDIGWRWATAAYSSFSGDNNVLGVEPMDMDNDNPPKNHDRAGTPENFKPFAIPGARGKGGTNYTETYSRSKEIE